MEFQVLSNASEKGSSPELYSLGEFNSAKPTTFSITIDQTLWSGGCGLYYGYREEAVLGKNRSQAVFNVIWVFREGPPGPAQSQKYILQRAICRIDPDTLYPAFEEVGFGAEIPAHELFGGRELSFDISAGEISEVRWNKKPLPRLLRRVGATNLAGKQWRGPWGVMNLIGTTLFRGPKISELSPAGRAAGAP
jgi:hypothetical protein